MCVRLCVFVPEYIGMGWVLAQLGLLESRLTYSKCCVCGCVCAERPGVPVSGSLAAAGKLKCHDWLPAALGPTLSVAGWLLI